MNTSPKPVFSRTLKIIAASLILTRASAVFSQDVGPAKAQSQANLAASASIDVAQDVLSIAMTTSKEGVDANQVQTQLKLALDAGLAEARKTAQPGQMEVKTGAFSLYPRYGRDGKPTGWQGSAELILQGRDFARISAAAGKIQTLTVGNVNFSLSREQRARVEADAQAQAIEGFKTRAQEIAKSFGFASYSLREVSVSANDQGFAPTPRMMTMAKASMSSDAPIPVEAGKTAVTVVVSGTIQMK